MTLTQRPAPHIRHNDSISVPMTDTIIAIVPCVAMSTYLLGFRFLVNCAVSVLSCMLIELLICVVLRRRITLDDMSSVLSGIIIAMLMPVGINYDYIFLAAAVAMIVAKWMYGGLGKNIFNPAVLGVSVVSLINRVGMTTFYGSNVYLPILRLDLADDFNSVSSVLSGLKFGDKVDIKLLDMLIGNQAGVPGAVCIPLVIISAGYLLYRRIISPYITLSAVITVGVIAMLAPRTDFMLIAAGYELLAGSLIFCLVFCANDPVTTPNTATGQILYGVLVGLFTMLIRYYGSYDDGVIFAILIVNAMSFALDKTAYRLHKNRHKLTHKEAVIKDA